VNPDLQRDIEAVFGSSAAKRVDRKKGKDQGLDRWTEGLVRREYGQTLPDLRTGRNNAKEMSVDTDDIDRGDTPPDSIPTDVDRYPTTALTSEQYYAREADAEAMAREWRAIHPEPGPKKTRRKALLLTLRRILNAPDVPEEDEVKLRPEDFVPDADVGQVCEWDEDRRDAEWEAERGLRAKREAEDRAYEEWMAPWTAWAGGWTAAAAEARAEYRKAGVCEVPEEPFELVAYWVERGEAVGQDRCVHTNETGADDCANKISRKRDGLCRKHVDEDKRDRTKGRGK
jgi:hypothetical protein